MRIEDRVCVPEWVVDSETFRRWARSEEAPADVPVCFSHGKVLIELSRDAAHDRVKEQILTALDGLASAGPGGMLFSGHVLLAHPFLDLTTSPDGGFVSAAALLGGAIRRVERNKAGRVYLEGLPDLVLEVVSSGSARRDLELLRALYYEAGIEEYWVADARGEPRLEILRAGPGGYSSSAGEDGWQVSEVFGRAFRLEQHPDEQGGISCRLAVR